MQSEKLYGTTRLDQLEELKRELEARRRVFPIWYKKRRITKEQAVHRLNCLQAVIDDFEQRHNPTAKQGSLGI